MSYGDRLPSRGHVYSAGRPDRNRKRADEPYNRGYTAGSSSGVIQDRRYTDHGYDYDRHPRLPENARSVSTHHQDYYRSHPYEDQQSRYSGYNHANADQGSSRTLKRYDDLSSSPRRRDDATKSRRRQGLDDDDDEDRRRKVPQHSPPKDQLNNTGWTPEKKPRSGDRDVGSSQPLQRDLKVEMKKDEEEAEVEEEEEDGEVRQKEPPDENTKTISNRKEEGETENQQGEASVRVSTDKARQSQDGQRTKEIRHSRPTTEIAKRGESSKVRYDGEEEVERADTLPKWQAEPWEEEGDTEKECRVRKRNRPLQVPLRARTFYGCSSIDQYTLGVKLGQGTFGEVKKATHSLTGIEVALKKVTIHEEQDGMPITAIREIKLLKKLSHPAIVSVIDMAYRAPTERGKLGEVFMVEPYMDHDLNGMLENPSIHFTIAQIKLYMKQLLEGTLYMHQNNILHRDMKAANLLINNRGQLQIADFGLARPYHDPGRAWEAKGWNGGRQGYTSMVVTRWYRPPELLAGDRKYGPPVDMWGLGCILAEMLLEKPLFQGNTEIDQLNKIAQLCGSPNEETYPDWSSLPGVKNAEADGRPDPEPKKPGQHDFGPYPRKVVEFFTKGENGGISVRQELANLLDKLLVLDPKQRMTAKEALEHEWFWQAPFPADPEALPTYQASKELDRQRRDHQKKQQQQEQNRIAAQNQAQMYLQSNHHVMTSTSSNYGVASGQQQQNYNKRPPISNGHMNHHMPGQHNPRGIPTGPSAHFQGSNSRPMPKMFAQNAIRPPIRPGHQQFDSRYHHSGPPPHRGQSSAPSAKNWNYD